MFWFGGDKYPRKIFTVTVSKVPEIHSPFGLQQMPLLTLLHLLCLLKVKMSKQRNIFYIPTLLLNTYFQAVCRNTQ